MVSLMELQVCCCLLYLLLLNGLSIIDRRWDLAQIRWVTIMNSWRPLISFWLAKFKNFSWRIVKLWHGWQKLAQSERWPFCATTQISCVVMCASFEFWDVSGCNSGLIEKERHHCKIFACFLQAVWGSEKDITPWCHCRSTEGNWGSFSNSEHRKSHPILSINDAIYLRMVNHNKEYLLGTLPQIMSELAKMQTMRRSYACIHHLFALIRIHSFQIWMKGVEGSKAECLGSFWHIEFGWKWRWPK